MEILENWSRIKRLRLFVCFPMVAPLSLQGNEMHFSQQEATEINALGCGQIVRLYLESGVLRFALEGKK